jgi:rhodanese-related sulfurtransferase
MGTVIPLILPTPEVLPLTVSIVRASSQQKKTQGTGGWEVKDETMFFTTYECQNIGPEALNTMMKSGEDFLLLDVRTPAEYAAQAIENSYLIPLQELGLRIDELPKSKEIVVYCRIGNRSAYACAYLARMGYNVKNLEGGIMLWNMAGNVSVTRASS